jgi:23S rRNA (uracil-5-)-methyltransferase RumA
MSKQEKNKKDFEKKPSNGFKNIKENDQFILDIKRMGINGEGIGFYNRLAIFVDGAIPGEGHNIEISKLEGKMAYGKSIECKHASNARKMPECPYYAECGGCSVMHIDYQEMLKYKREIVIEALSRYTTINPKSFEIKNTIPSDYTLGYRNKSQLNVKKNDGKMSVAMIKAKSNILVPVDKCLVQKDLINTLNKKVLSILEEAKVEPYIRKTNTGSLRYLVIRATKENKALVCFVCQQKDAKLKELVNKLLAIPEIVSVYENINSNDKSLEIFGKETNHLGGEEYDIETLGKIKYKIYPTTFFQLNSYQAEKMYDVVLKQAKLSFKERVLDAYCGVGTIALYLAHNSKEVIGIEYNKESIKAAEENAKLNKISNAKFLQGDASELLPKMLRDGEVFDVLVADPPRTGLGEKFISAILESKVKKFIYVSCNPATLAKDLEKLKECYSINSITPLDMFPQTALVETVALLTLNPSVKK